MIAELNRIKEPERRGKDALFIYQMDLLDEFYIYFSYNRFHIQHILFSNLNFQFNLIMEYIFRFLSFLPTNTNWILDDTPYFNLI